MKKILYLGIVLMFASCGDSEEVPAKSDASTVNESESESSTVNVDGREVSTIKIGNLEVMTEDLGATGATGATGDSGAGVFYWKDAKKACADLGDGWRLPTKDELNILYENRYKIGGFGSSGGYWSSTAVGNDDAWLQDFSTGYQMDGFHPHSPIELYVRAVRAF
jgi:hypothetical protein